MERVLKDKMETILNETTKLSFPFFTGDDKKKDIMRKERIRLKSCITNLLSLYNLNEIAENIEEEKIWDDAWKTSAKKFNSLPDGVKINSFFLQELMHEYVRAMIEKIEDMIY